MARLLSIMGMAIALGSSMALDQWVLELRRVGHSTLRLGPTLWGTALAMLATVTVVLLLGWHVAYQSRGDRLVGSLYLIVGLALLAFSPLAFAAPSPVIGLMSSPALRTLRLLLLRSSGISLFQLTSAATVSLGIVVLMSRRSESPGKSVPV